MKKLIKIVCTAVLSAAMLAGCAAPANNTATTQPAATETPVAEATEAPAETEAEAPAETAAEAPAEETAASRYELALVTDVGTIDDKSFNQGAWEGLEGYAKEKSITYKYYQPPEKTTDAYISTIDLAIKGGAKVVVCPGFLFEPAVLKAQEKYPDTKFVLLDGVPNSGDYSDIFIAPNTVSVFYEEQQSGFLAGYAAVKDGYTKLGFMGGMAVPAVIRFGYGFVQGAEYAAQEMGLAEGALDLKYNYTGSFSPSPEIQSKAASWYQTGTEVIFSCGGGICTSIMAAAEAANAKVIGVDVDQSAESATVITSAKKELSNSVYEMIKQFYDNKFPGGSSVTLSAADNGVGLPEDFSRFNTFVKADYDAIFAKLAGNQIELLGDTRDGNEVTPTDIPVKAVKLSVIQ